MMQETGNKSPETQKNILSIQVSLNGLSFCIFRQPVVSKGKFPVEDYVVLCGSHKYVDAMPSEEPITGKVRCFSDSVYSEIEKYLRKQPWMEQHFQQVNIILDTERVCFYPESEKIEFSAEKMLETSGWVTPHCDKVILFYLSQSIRGAMLVDERLIVLFQSIFDGPIFTHPHAYRTMWVKHHGLSLLVTDGFVHLHLTHNGKTRFLRTFPNTNEADVLFLLERFNSVFHLKNTPIIVFGQQAEKVVEFCKPYFKNISIQQGKDQLWYMTTLS